MSTSLIPNWIVQRLPSNQLIISYRADNQMANLEIGLFMQQVQVIQFLETISGQVLPLGTARKKNSKESFRKSMRSSCVYNMSLHTQPFVDIQKLFLLTKCNWYGL